MVRYLYRIEGLAAAGQTWSTTGTVEIDQPGKFPEAPSLALRKSFEALTEGRAVYGHPGLGCHGPYAITQLILTREDDRA